MISQHNYLKYLLIVGVLVLFYIICTRMFTGHTEDQSDAAKLESIPIIDIDYRGKFKYVLGQIYGKNSAGRMVLSKIVVRGNTRFTHHADVCDNLRDTVAELGLKAKCIGGGRIEHFPDAKKIKIYGYSESYGKADHKKTKSLLYTTYPDYLIEISDTGY